MLAGGARARSVRVARDGWAVETIDQTRLPHELCLFRIESAAAAAEAIRDMVVRGAPLIGVIAAHGVALEMRRDPTDPSLAAAVELLAGTRPTAVNLRWALEEMQAWLRDLPPEDRAAAAHARAVEIAEADVELCRRIGEHGLVLIRSAADRSPGRAVQVLTHCNAGWLAAVDWGTALAPVYRAQQEGIDIHVWVSETRPRNQGAGLTAWELGEQGVPHTVIADSASGLLMQRGQVDLVLTGTDRTTATGDVCNKIGTYLKALAARESGVPFYAAVPGPSIDWTLRDGADIPIEERAGEEVSEVRGLGRTARLESVRITPAGTPVANYAFDVTPARLVTGLVTERGICEASEEGLLRLYPERA